MRGALLWLPFVFVLAGCGGTAHRAPQAQAQKPASHAPAARVCKAGVVTAGRPNVAVAAIVHSSAVAFRRPGAKPFARFARLNVNGFPTVFRVLDVVRASDCTARWYRVQLPLKPNGVTGFVRASAVGTGPVDTRVVVDLSARRLTLYRGGRPVLHAPVAVGSPATPTPLGRFYVNQRLIPPDPGGPYGPAAIGISAFSNVLTGWAQGGPIAIHGTNEPWSIGHAVSNGCIRVHNDVLQRLFKETPAGTPVVIRA